MTDNAQLSQNPASPQPEEMSEPDPNTVDNLHLSSEIPATQPSLGNAIPPHSPRQISLPIKLAMIALVGLAAISIGTILWITTVSNDSLPLDQTNNVFTNHTDNSSQSPLPASTQPTSVRQVTHLQIADLVFPLPTGWTPIFSIEEPSDAPRYIVLTDDPDNAFNLAINCQPNSSCTGWTVRLGSQELGHMAGAEVLATKLRDSHSIDIGEFQSLESGDLTIYHSQQFNSRAFYVVVRNRVDLTKNVLISVESANQEVSTQILESLTKLQLSPRPTTQAPLSEMKGFQLTLNQNIHYIPMLYIDNILENLFGNPSSPTSRYHYRLFSSFEDPHQPFGLSMFLLTNNPSLTAGTYSNVQYQFKLEPLPDTMLKYLDNQRYCEQDTDCSVRPNGCTIGGFNKYSEFHTGPWGCGMPSYDGISEENHLELGTCTNYEVVHEGARCSNNTCQAYNPQIICKDTP